MPAPDYLFDLPRLDRVVRRPGYGGAYSRAVLYSVAEARAVEAMVYSDGAAYDRADRNLFEVRDADGGGRLVQFERPTLSVVVTDPRHRRIVERWCRIGQPVRAVLVGTPWSDHVVWDVPSRPTGLEVDVENGSGRVSGWLAELVQPGAGLDEPHRPGGTVRRTPDLLAGAVDGILLDGLAEDDARPGLGLAWGLSATADAETTVENGEQRLTADVDVAARLEFSRVLPLSGIWVTAEAVVGGPDGAPLSATEYGRVRVAVAALGQDGTLLAEAEAQALTGSPELTGPVLVAPSVYLPDGTWSVRLRLSITGDGATVVALSSLRLLTVDAADGAWRDAPGGRYVGGLYVLNDDPEAAGYADVEAYGLRRDASGETTTALATETYEVQIELPDGTVATGTRAYAELTPTDAGEARVTPDEADATARTDGSPSVADATLRDPARPTTTDV